MSFVKKKLLLYYVCFLSINNILYSSEKNNFYDGKDSVNLTPLSTKDFADLVNDRCEGSELWFNGSLNRKELEKLARTNIKENLKRFSPLFCEFKKRKKEGEDLNKFLDDEKIYFLKKVVVELNKRDQVLRKKKKDDTFMKYYSLSISSSISSNKSLDKKLLEGLSGPRTKNPGTLNFPKNLKDLIKFLLTQALNQRTQGLGLEEEEIFNKNILFFNDHVHENLPRGLSESMIKTRITVFSFLLNTFKNPMSPEEISSVLNKFKNPMSPEEISSIKKALVELNQMYGKLPLSPEEISSIKKALGELNQMYGKLPSYESKKGEDLNNKSLLTSKEIHFVKRVVQQFNTIGELLRLKDILNKGK
jgi:hypothetical protein